MQSVRWKCFFNKQKDPANIDDEFVPKPWDVKTDKKKLPLRLTISARFPTRVTSRVREAVRNSNIKPLCEHQCIVVKIATE